MTVKITVFAFGSLTIPSVLYMLLTLLSYSTKKLTFLKTQTQFSSKENKTKTPYSLYANQRLKIVSPSLDIASLVFVVSPTASTSV